MMGNFLLEIENMSKQFGGVRAVQGLSFRVYPSTIHAIIGPNGAGKTTVFNVITGIYRPDNGCVKLRGKPLEGLSPHRVALEGVARTFQNLEIFSSLSVIENVMVGCLVRGKTGMVSASLRLPTMRQEEKDVRRKAQEILEFVGLGKQAKELSGELPFGRQRLLEIARALATEPSLLLLDEPASGLNPNETVKLGTLIQRLRDNGITVLMVEHDMSLTMDISDTILVMNYGRQIASGPPRKIQNDPAVIAAYLGEETDA